MSARKKRKRRLTRIVPFWIRIVIVITACMLLLLAAGTFLLPRFGIELNLPFSSRSRTSESEILLKDIRPLFLLNTVQYTYKSVFPYDFIPPDTDPLQAYRRYLQGADITGREKKAAEIYRLCQDSGIRLDGFDYSFVVITTHVKGGFDLSEGPWAASENAAHLIAANPSLESISILLPDPIISEFIIRDEMSTEYEYPDIDLDAEQWRRVSDYVEQQIREKVVEDGILEKTEENMQRLLRRILQDLGWKYITFTREPAAIQ
jgi:hypothetical protein